MSQSVEGFARRANDGEKYAVYGGGGEYLSRVSVASSAADGVAGFEFVEFKGAAVALSRGEAIAACHSARRCGIPAWIVPAPVGLA